MLYRAREPPAALMRAPIAIQRLNRSRVRQNEYAAIPMSATAPGIVNRYENARTLGSAIGVPAAGTVAASADMFMAGPGAAGNKPKETPPGGRGQPIPARRGKGEGRPNPQHRHGQGGEARINHCTRHGPR